MPSQRRVSTCHAAASFRRIKTTAVNNAGTPEKTMWRSRVRAAIRSAHSQHSGSQKIALATVWRGTLHREVGIRLLPDCCSQDAREQVLSDLQT
jgi:hypothetical protein